MNIASETAINIKITSDEVRNVLLDYIKRMAGGVIKKDMELIEIEMDGDFKDVTFTWMQNRNKDIR